MPFLAADNTGETNSNSDRNGAGVSAIVKHPGYANLALVGTGTPGVNWDNKISAITCWVETQ